MMKKSKNPRIRFKGFTDDWEQRKFEDMFKRRMERNGGQFDITKWISVAKMYYQDPKKVTSNNIDTRTYVMRKGDIAFEGHPNAEFKFGRFVENDIGDGIISELFPIYQHIDKFDLNYWKYSIQLEHLMQSKLARCVVISYTSSNKLDENLFLQENILVPSVDEQEKIGDLFRSLDHIITLHQRKLEKLELMKKSLLQKMFPKSGNVNPKIRFKGYTDDWEQRKVGEICSISTGKSNTQDKVDSGKYPLYVRSPIIEHSEKYLYDEEAVLTVGDGVGTGKVFHYVNGKYDLHQRVYRMYNFSDCVDARFFYEWFSKNFYKRVMSMTAKTSVDSVRYDMISEMDMRFPLMSEQIKIADFLFLLEQVITLHQRKLEKLKLLKKTLLQDMFPSE